LLLKRKFTTGLKNNLQVISSLLDLQADKFKNQIGVTSSEIIDVSGEVRIE
jgi:two-component sensor histidine kinase